MSRKLYTSKTEKPAEKRTVRPRYVAPERVYLPTTVRLRAGEPRINLPIECRDVRYCRIVTADGTVEFRPDPNGEMTATQDGYRSYAPMPAGTAGVRYRRVINRTTGVVMLTPINTKRTEETA